MTAPDSIGTKKRQGGEGSDLRRLRFMGGVRSRYYHPAPHSNRYTRPKGVEVARTVRRGFRGMVSRVAGLL